MKTPIQFILDLNWDKMHLEEGKKMLKEWDARPDCFYKDKPKWIIQVDKKEREHLRNAIAYWEKKLDET